MSNIRNLMLAGASAVAVAATLAAAPVHAQTEAPAPGAAAVEEVIVTARKREENVINVPIAITNYSAKELTRTGTTKLADLAAMTPGLTFQDVNGAYAAPTIRGVAQVDQTSLQGNVGVFIDGIYLNNRSGLEFGLMDVDRIEIDKGPQAALYGRNTFAGAINYITPQPILGKFTGHLAGEVGTYGLRTVQASVSVPMADVAALRIFFGEGDFDGTIKNLRDGKYLGGYTGDQAYGASFLYKPTDQFTLKAFYMKSEVNNSAEPLVQQSTLLNNCGSTTIRNGVTYRTLYCGTVHPVTQVNVNDTIGYGTQGTNELAYGTLAYDFGFATLSGTVSYNKGQYANLVDTVANPINITIPTIFGSAQTYVEAVTPNSEDTSVDVRLASPGGQKVDWTIGFYGYNSDLTNITAVSAQPLNQPSAAPVPFSVSGGRTQAKGRAVYGSLGVKATDALSLTAELRYTQEDQDFNGVGSLAVVAGRANKGSQSFKYWAPRFTATYAIGPQTNLYASAARGVKTGNFNGNAFGPAPAYYKYGIESNWSYEAGIKTAGLMDGRLRATADVFWIDWSGIQGQQNVPGSTLSIVRNQGGATSKGVEADVDYAFTENFSLRASASYADPKYKSGFKDGDLAAPCGDYVGSLIKTVGCTDIVSGNQIGRTSKYQFAIAPSLNFPEAIAGWDLYARADYSYQSGKYTTGNETQDQGAIKLLNGRIGVSRGGVDFAVWGKNLADYKYNDRVTIAASTNDGAPATGIDYIRIYPGARRTFGARLDYRF